MTILNIFFKYIIDVLFLSINNSFLNFYYENKKKKKKLTFITLSKLF